MTRLISFGKYELLSRLAKGGMAETWRAQLKGAAGVTKTVVIKKVLPHFAEDPQFIEAFVNEAKISASLSHGNIAQVFDFGRVDGDYFLAMELVDGQSLAQVLARAAERGFEKIPPPLACFLCSELLKGLHYAHTRVGADGAPLRVVHRDVSPENVLVSYEGQVKVVDFGVAKAVLDGRKETEPGMVKGKFQFFSPEQALAEPLDARSDVFAAGVVLYRMLCGRLPFDGHLPLVLRNIVDGVYPPPLQANPDLPEALVAVLTRALQRQREDRFATALQMQQALSAWLHGHFPSFSEETVKDWMTWLFRPELEHEGRDASVSGEFTHALSQWQTPAPGGRRIAPLATGARAVPSKVPAVVWVASAALVLGGAAALWLMPSSPAVPPAVASLPPMVQAPVPRKGPAPLVAPDEVAFPGAATVSAAKHRLQFQRVTLPEVRAAREGRTAISEAPAPGLAPLFLLERSSRADADGHVAVVVHGGSMGLLPFTSLKLFDFQPFGGGQAQRLRSVTVGAESRHFASSDAQLDGRNAGWVTVTGVTGRARLTLTPVDPKAWERRPRKASVLVAWRRAPDAAPAVDEADWPGGVTRAVLQDGAPLVVDGATTFAFAFADSYATEDSDSVRVNVEAAPDAEVQRRMPDAVPPTPDQIDDLVAVNHPRLLPCFTVLVWEGENTYVDVGFDVARGKVEHLTLAPPKQRKQALSQCLLKELDTWRFAKLDGPAKAVKLHYSARAQNFDPQPQGSAPPETKEERSALIVAQQQMRDKDYEGARATLEGCLRANPNNAGCHMRLGACLARLGDRDGAAMHYQAFVRMAPPNTPEVKFAKKILADYGWPTP